LAEKHLLYQVLEKRTLTSLERLQQIVGMRLPLKSEGRQLHACPPALQACVHCLDVLLGKPEIRCSSSEESWAWIAGSVISS
jgi:hypothetical protein